MGGVHRRCQREPKEPYRERIRPVSQASLSPQIKSAAPSAGPDHVSNEHDGRHSAVTLWLFGLTAMTLVFASLLILGLLARRGIVDPSVSNAVNAYTILTSTIGLVALAYVLTMARKAGLLTSSQGAEADAPASPPSDGLRIAPAVTAGVAPRVRQKTVAAQQARSRQARAIAAAAVPRTPRRSQIDPAPAPMRVAPKPSPSRVYPSAPTAVKAAARMKPSVAPGATIPVVAPRSAGAAPAWLRPARPPVGMPVQPAAFQVRIASLRAPFWVEPRRPTLVDRFLGRGIHAPYPSPPPPPAVIPPVSRAPQPVGRH